MDDKLSIWLAKELEKRGWSHRELARRAGVSQTAVSQAISEERNVGWDFCAAIAIPLGVLPEQVLRLAGLLSPQPETNEDEEWLLATYRKIPHQQREFLLGMLRATQGHVPSPVFVPPPSDVIGLPDQSAPDLEDIAEAAKHLDELERRLVFDYIRWRLMEQEHRRSSSGKRKRDPEADRQTIGLINLYEAVQEATPQQQTEFISYLVELYLNKKTKELHDDNETSASGLPIRNQDQAARPG